MKKFYFAVFVSASIYFGAFSIPAEASSVIRTGDTISVEKDQKVEGDFYSLTNILNMSGGVSEDLLSAGRKVTLNGSVGTDALIAGETINIHGQIGDDLRIVGGDVTIAEAVAGDVFVVAGRVNVLSTASIGGDVIIYAGSATISGSVGGGIMGRAESLTIDAPVGGLVDVTILTLSLGDKASLSQGIKYISSATLLRSPNATVTGDVVRNDPLTEEVGISTRQYIIVALMFLFASLAWYLIARSVVVKIVDRALVPTVRPTIVGFLTLVMAPVVIGVLLVSILGMFIGAALLMTYVLSVFLALFTMGAVLAQLAMYAYKKTVAPLSPLLVLLGTAGVFVLGLIPLVGAVILTALFIVTLGALVDVILRPQQ